MFSPAKVIFAGIGVLLLVNDLLLYLHAGSYNVQWRKAAKDLHESQSTLVEILEQIENFFRRLEIYAEVPPTPAMKDTMVKIMVEVLGILAIATKEMKQSRASELTLRIALLLAHVDLEKFLKKLAGRTDMVDALTRLDKLTNEEARLAGAQVLKNTHMIDDKLTGVGDGVKVVDEKVEEVDTRVKSVRSEVQRVSNNVDDVKRSSSFPSLLTVEHKTRLQGTNYGRV